MCTRVRPWQAWIMAHLITSAGRHHVHVGLPVQESVFLNVK